MQAVDASEHKAMTRAGFATVIGRPNAGKSTLLNALLGEKLSIVTARAQTTRESVRGILTSASSQIVFVDTPGLVDPAYLLHRSMLHSALVEVGGADVVLLLLDATRPGESPPAQVVDVLRERGGRPVVAINKIDAGTSDAIRALTSWSTRELGVVPVLVSAAAGQGLTVLRERLEEALPQGPFLHPEDELATQPVRFFVEELVRETIFEEYEQEIPYACAVRIEEYREAAEPLYIRAVIYVERISQKGIVIGKGGSMIRRLGERSREKIEAFIDRHVYLDLWVKVLPGWRRKAGALKYLGYPLPPEPQDEH